MEDPGEEDVFTILIATDNHIGYNEKDPIRGQDSIVTFEEILKLSKERNVDFILQGGDLFHENKPSRQVVHKTMELLRTYCMGDKPVTFQVLSEQAANFKHCCFQHVNYEDPNYNISTPVFMIHGNHDDPVGDGNLSAVDILSVANLVNYFGKSDSVEDITVNPVLLEKGRTRIALYGLGNIRDERLHRAWKNEKVKFLRPQESSEDWFNILVLHQNRARHGLRNFIPEEFIPSFFDLVVWGHEHECRIEAEYRQFGVDDEVGFYITQPGSSVATSLADGEAKPKHAAVLYVKGTDFKIEPVRLETVRPFLLDTITLADSEIEPQDHEEVLRYLEERVQELIDRGTAGLANETENPVLPLARMKVDYSGGYEKINIPRFGRKFSTQVANPNNILMFFHRRIEPTVREGKQKDGGVSSGDFLSKTKDNVNIQKFLYDILNGADLKLLSAKNLVESIKEYVEKGEREAIEEVVTCSVSTVQTVLKKKPLTDLSEDISEEIERSREELQARQEEEGQKTIQRLAEYRQSNPQKRLHESDSDPDGFGDDDEYDLDVSVQSGGRGRGRGRGKKRGSTTTQSSSTRGARGGRGRGRGRGGKSSSSTTARQSNRSHLDFVDPAPTTSSAVMRGIVQSKSSKRSAINYEDVDEDTGGDGSWTSTSRKKQKLSSSTQDNSDIVDLTQTSNPQTDHIESNPFSAIFAKRRKK